MKKTLLFLLILLAPSLSFAASSCTEKIRTIYKQSGAVEATKHKLTLACTSHTDGTVSVALSASTVAFLEGHYLYMVSAYPGGTAPTDDADLQIVATRTGYTKSIDLLGGNGTNLIDATTTKETLPKLAFPSVNFYPMIDADNTYTITGANAGDSKTMVFELMFTP